ncbi:hypothetical protein ZWY2020_023382 [Hordeum vulgare]|nr:hypothetical protein ZWY2020_023382 [Hordeum vulgare]
MFSSKSSSGQARKPGLEDGCNHGVMWGRVQGLGHNTAGLHKLQPSIVNNALPCLNCFENLILHYMKASHS